jgi:hypothetical protein
MTRDEYLINPGAHCKRGFDLPQAKIPPIAIQSIRDAELRKEITEKYSNAALAKAWGVHERTIEKILAYETWRHVL